MGIGGGLPRCISVVSLQSSRESYIELVDGDRQSWTTAA